MAAPESGSAQSILDGLVSDGWCTLPLLDGDSVASLRGAFELAGSPPDDSCRGRRCTADSSDRDYRQHVDAMVRRHVQEPLRLAFPTWEVVRAGITITWSYSAGGVGLHRGDCVGPAPAGPTPTHSVFIALTPTQQTNGEDWIVPRSHRLAEDPASERARHLLTNWSQRIELDVGEGLVADRRLLRSSSANITDKLRLMAQLDLVGTAPANDSVHLVDLVPGTDHDVSPPNPRHPWCGRCGSDLRDTEVVDRWVGTVETTCTSCSVLPPPRWSRRDRRPPPSEQQTEPDGNLTPLPVRSRRLLVDEALESKTQRDGWATFPLCAPDELRELRETFFELAGTEGSGFHNDFHERDLTYRERARQRMSEVLDGRLTELVDGYEPFLHTFLTKWPGENSRFDIHRDWMFVDERLGHRAFLFFVPLEDVDGHNGQVRMLSGSHRIDGYMRGTNLWTPWLRHQDVIDRRLETVPVRVGECAVWDTSITHSSYPNYTDRPRVAAGVWMKPVEAGTVHVKGLGDGRAVVYDAPDFYETTHPYSLMVNHPDLDTIAVVPDGGVNLEADQLALALDQMERARWSGTTDAVVRPPMSQRVRTRLSPLVRGVRLRLRRAK